MVSILLPPLKNNRTTLTEIHLAAGVLPYQQTGGSAGRLAVFRTSWGGGAALRDMLAAGVLPYQRTGGSAGRLLFSAQAGAAELPCATCSPQARFRISGQAAARAAWLFSAQAGAAGAALRDRLAAGVLAAGAEEGRMQ